MSRLSENWLEKVYLAFGGPPACSIVLILTVISSILFSNLYAQDCVLGFASPVRHKTVLSGSYGEPRTRHFHAGIDYKQYHGIPNDTIYAVADGYVSRINIHPDGYGNALYINHDCNKTSVYAHLYEFAPETRSYIRDVLYQEKIYSISHNLSKDSIQVKKGQYIGIMGSTGRSSGPHLHFEIRNTSSETPINPALLGLKPKDDIPPKIVGIMVYGLTPDDQEISKNFITARHTGNDSYTLGEEPIISDHFKIGLGIRTYDQMNGASNHNGIYRLNMKVDGRSTFSFKLDSIPFNLSKYIHSHMDYEEKENRKYVTKCFLNPINKLDLYNTVVTKGAIHLFQFRKTKIEIKVEDIEGNTSSITFYMMRGDYPELISSGNPKGIRVLPTDSITIDLGNTQITFDQETFSQPIVLDLPIVTDTSIDLSQEKKIPTFKYFKISQNMKEVKHPRDKYVFMRTTDKGEVERYKARWENDSTAVTFLNVLDKYTVGLDTVSPSIKVISLPGPKSKRFKIQLTDNLVPVYDIDELNFDIFLDNEWIWAQHDAKTETIWLDVPEALDPSIDHTLKVVVMDGSDNRAELARSFKL